MILMISLCEGPLKMSKNIDKAFKLFNIFSFLTLNPYINPSQKTNYLNLKGTIKACIEGGILFLLILYIRQSSKKFF